MKRQKWTTTALLLRQPLRKVRQGAIDSRFGLLHSQREEEMDDVPCTTYMFFSETETNPIHRLDYGNLLSTLQISHQHPACPFSVGFPALDLCSCSCFCAQYPAYGDCALCQRMHMHEHVFVSCFSRRIGFLFFQPFASPNFVTAGIHQIYTDTG